MRKGVETIPRLARLELEALEMVRRIVHGRDRKNKLYSQRPVSILLSNRSLSILQMPLWKSDGRSMLTKAFRDDEFWV